MMRLWKGLAALAAGSLGVGLSAVPAASAAAGLPGDAESVIPAVSSTGRYVVFQSNADNLVPGGPSPFWQIMIRDVVAGTTRLVSASADGRRGNGDSFVPSVSADGRFVTFQSTADNLVAGTGEEGGHVFRKDMRTGAVIAIDVRPAAAASDGPWSARMSGDGQRIVFTTYAKGIVPGDTDSSMDLFMYDVPTKTMSRLTPRKGNTFVDVYSADISDDGRTVVWYQNIYGTGSCYEFRAVMMWKEGQRTGKRVTGSCTSKVHLVAAHNAGLGVERLNPEPPQDRSTIKVTPARPNAAYSVECAHYPTYGCEFDLARWGDVGVAETNDGLLRFDASGGRQLLKSSSISKYPAISADGRSIAFVDHGQVKLWRPATSRVILVSQSSN